MKRISVAEYHAKYPEVRTEMLRMAEYFRRGVLHYLGTKEK